MLDVVQPPILAPPQNECQAVARVIPGAPAAAPIWCWRIGPLRLGMDQAQVEAAMGPPVQDRPLPSDPTVYRAEIFAIPRDWRARLAASAGRRPVRLRLVEVLFRRGEAAAIETDAPARIDGVACAGKADPPALEIGGEPPGFAPFASFAGARTGDPVASLKATFGRAPSANASQDWLNLFPAPIALGADPDTGRVTSFAIGRDEDAVTRGDVARIRIVRDPATCRIRDLVFGG